MKWEKQREELKEALELLPPGQARTVSESLRGNTQVLDLIESLCYTPQEGYTDRVKEILEAGLGQAMLGAKVSPEDGQKVVEALTGNQQAVTTSPKPQAKFSLKNLFRKG